MTTPLASRLFQHALLDELCDIQRRRNPADPPLSRELLAQRIRDGIAERPESTRAAYAQDLERRIGLYFDYFRGMVAPTTGITTLLEVELLGYACGKDENEYRCVEEFLSIKCEDLRLADFMGRSVADALAAKKAARYREHLLSRVGLEIQPLKMDQEVDQNRLLELEHLLRGLAASADDEQHSLVEGMLEGEPSDIKEFLESDWTSPLLPWNIEHWLRERLRSKYAVALAAAKSVTAKGEFAFLHVLSASNMQFLRAHLACCSSDEAADFFAEMITAFAQGKLDEMFAFWRLTQKQVRDYALSQNIVGFALSGGGIRSATFGLGAFQAMAELGMLPRFDYLSSVSGGGYISAWLAAWIQREGNHPAPSPTAPPMNALANVVLQLDPSRRVQARAERDGVPPNDARDSEPFPIYHLRAYSNFLTPLLGIFSADGWAILSTYLRNFFLNQSVFLLLLLACWCGIAAIVRLFSAAGELPCVVDGLDKQGAICPIVGNDQGAWLRICRLAGLVMTFYFIYVAGNGINMLLPAVRSQTPKPGNPDTPKKGSAVWHLFLGAPALVLLSWYLHSWWSVAPTDRGGRFWQFAVEVCWIWAVLCLHTATRKILAPRRKDTDVPTTGELWGPRLVRLSISLIFLIGVLALAVDLVQDSFVILKPVKHLGVEAACAGVLCFALITLLDLARLVFQPSITTDIHDDPAASRAFLWYNILLPLLMAMLIAALTVTLLFSRYQGDAFPMWAWAGLAVACAVVYGRFFLLAWKVQKSDSLDGWSGLFALLFVAPLFVEAYMVLKSPLGSTGWCVGHFLIFLTLALAHGYCVWRCHLLNRWWRWYYVVGGVLGLTVLLKLAVVGLAAQAWIPQLNLSMLNLPAAWSGGIVCAWAILQLYVVGYLGCDFQSDVGPRGRACGLIAGSFGGSALYWSMWALFEKVIRVCDADSCSPASVAGAAAFCVPILLLIFALTGYVQVAVMREKLSGLLREWWASLSGWILTLAGLWLAIVGLAIFGTWLLIPEWNTGAGLKIASGIAWAFTTISGLYLSHSPKTSGEPATKSMMDRIREALAYFAPIVFIVGLGLIVCLLVLWLLFAIFEADFNHETYWQAFLLHEFWPFQAWSSLLLEPLVFLIAGGLLLAVVYGRGPIPGIGQAVDVNLFSLHGMYTIRLVRCYLGASRQPKSGFSSPVDPVPSNSAPPRRQPNALTEFDEQDDLLLADFVPDKSSGAYTGPVLILNTALNWASGNELAWQERKAESFILTARWCGSTTTHYRPTTQFGDGISLGTAVGISGAAVSPNMGYHSTAGVTLLLTLFNARLGAWLGNPKRATWKDRSPKQGIATLLKEALGRTSAEDDYIYLSDGGHFDNLGIYELVRRRCRFIIAYDAGADPGSTFDDLAMVIRKVRVDFGVRIMIDVEPLRPQGPKRLSSRHIVIGKIYYKDVDAPVDAPTEGDNSFHWNPANIQEGVLVYIKPSLTGDEPTDVQNYRDAHPEFPHESTIDQFFSESQFESYRALGFHCFSEAFRTVKEKTDNADFFEHLFEHWCSIPPEFTGVFTTANTGYLNIQGELGRNPHLRKFQQELADSGIRQRRRRSQEEEQAERAIVAQMLTLIENTYFGLRLDRYLEHPVNQGWRTTFGGWANTPTFEHFYGGLIKEFSKPIWLFMTRLNKDLKNPSV